MKPYTRENFHYAFGFTHNISKYSQFCKNKNKTAFFYVVSLPIGAKNFIVLLDKLKVFLFAFYHYNYSVTFVYRCVLMIYSGNSEHN